MRTSDGDSALEIVLPAQFFTSRCIQVQPEKRLMVAVLEDAVNTFQGLLGARNAAGRRLFHEAEAWFECDEDTDLFSFVNVCLVLGLEPHWVRRGLWNWRAARERGHGRAAA